MTSWEAYYTEDRIFCSDKYSWPELPNDGVLAVLIFEEKIPGQDRYYRKILQGDRCEWYFMLGDSIVCSRDTKEGILQRYPNAKHLKRGKWATKGDSEFEEVMNKAFSRKGPCGCK